MSQILAFVVSTSHRGWGLSAGGPGAKPPEAEAFSVIKH